MWKTQCHLILLLSLNIHISNNLQLYVEIWDYIGATILSFYYCPADICTFSVIPFYNIPSLSSSCWQLDAISPCFSLHPQHRRDDERGRTKEQLSFSLRLHPADVRAPMWRQIIAVSKSAVARYRQNTWALVCVCVRGCVTQNEIVSWFIPF